MGVLKKVFLSSFIITGSVSFFGFSAAAFSDFFEEDPIISQKITISRSVPFSGDSVDGKIQAPWVSIAGEIKGNITSLLSCQIGRSPILIASADLGPARLFQYDLSAPDSGWVPFGNSNFTIIQTVCDSFSQQIFVLGVSGSSQAGKNNTIYYRDYRNSSVYLNVTNLATSKLPPCV